MALTWGYATLGLLLVLLGLAAVAYGRRRRARWPAWQAALSPEGEERERYARVELELADQLGGLEDTLGLARARCEVGDEAEALRVLRLAAEHVARCVPSLVDRLWIWWDVARALAALYPLPRLRVLRFEGWRLRGAAAGEGLLRPLLGAGRRFKLRVRVLAYGLRVVLGGFRGALTSEPAGAARTLQRMEALGSDLGRLQTASLEVYKALLVSLQRRTKTTRDD